MRPDMRRIRRERLDAEEDLIDAVVAEVNRAIEERGITVAEIANQSGLSSPHVSQLLRGERNMNLKTAALLAYGAGIRLRVTAEDLS